MIAAIPVDFKTRQILDDLVSLGIEAQLVVIIDDYVGRLADLNCTPVVKAEKPAGTTTQDTVQLFEVDDSLVMREPSYEIDRPMATGEELAMSAAVGQTGNDPGVS